MRSNQLSYPPAAAIINDNMKIIRFKTSLTPPQYGWVHQNMVGVLQGDPYGESRRFEPEFDLANVELLVPCEPSKIVAIGKNYVDHAKELDSVVPPYPLIFMKPPSSLITTGQPIILPPQSTRVDHEAELAVVIKKKCRWLTIEEAKDAIFGYTIANDVTARDLQQQDNQWVRAKGFDTFCPLGPWIETELNASDAMISCHVNNALRQMGSTRDMVFDIHQLLAYITTFMTLLPGDVVLTGTPAGVSALKDGDTVTIHIEGIGTLINPVQAENKAQYSRKVSLG